MDTWTHRNRLMDSTPRTIVIGVLAIDLQISHVQQTILIVSLHLSRDKVLSKEGSVIPAL